MDYYSTLGVDKGATQEDIKQAYKKLAKQYHPDHGGDTDKFAQINEAYETLKDPAKRSQYNQPQRADFQFNSRNFTAENFNDFFGNVFRQQHQQQKNKDIVVRVIVSLSDVFNKKIEVIQYRLTNGTIETVNVEIPAGANTGDTIHYKGLGDNRDPSLTRGDLYVKVHVQEDKGWARDGVNLITRKKVNVFDILTGCAIMVTTPDNKMVNLKVPKGTKVGTILSINGYGLPNIKSPVPKKGNLYIQIEADIPMIDDPDILEKIIELKNLIKEKQ